MAPGSFPNASSKRVSDTGPTRRKPFKMSKAWREESSGSDTHVKNTGSALLKSRKLYRLNLWAEKGLGSA
jgi:hypothetical protein